MKVYLLVVYWLCYEQSPEIQEAKGCNSADATVAAVLAATARASQGERVVSGRSYVEAQRIVFAYYSSRKSCEQAIPKWQAQVEESSHRMADRDGRETGVPSDTADAQWSRAMR